MKRLVILFLVVFYALVSVFPALAHAALVSAKPGPGEVVPQSFSRIVLQFDDMITPQSQIQLVAADFELKGSWSQSVEGSTLTATLTEPLPPGTYTVAWTAVSLDTHSTTGSYQFAVSPAQAGSAAWGILVLIAAGLAAVVAGALAWRRRTPVA